MTWTPEFPVLHAPTSTNSHFTNKIELFFFSNRNQQTGAVLSPTISSHSPLVMMLVRARLIIKCQRRFLVIQSGLFMSDRRETKTMKGEIAWDLIREDKAFEKIH